MNEDKSRLIDCGDEYCQPFCHERQDAHTASIVRQEMVEEIEKIFKKIGNNIAYWEDKLAQYDNPNECPEWQAFKKREGL